MSQSATVSSLRFYLDGSEITIGRDPSCKVQVLGAGVSRFHASINLDPLNPSIKDTGSTYGTRVNGVEVSKASLQNGSVISIGIEQFTIELEDKFINLVSSVPDYSRGQEDNLLDQNKNITIGRSTESDIVLDHPLVSRIHAIVKRNPGGEIVLTDHKSTNGVFVNGIRISQSILSDGDIVQIGPFRLFVNDSTLVCLDDRNRIKIEASGITVVRNGSVLVDSAYFSVQPGEFTVILGASGAGKSTLVKTITGMSMMTNGAIYANGLPLKNFLQAFASSIGYVSQKNLLFNELTVEETFREQSIFRLPADSTIEERSLRIDETIKLLELENVVKRRICELSGGEAKRVHIGIELLSSPALIVLDEPLSGLDPGLVKRFMNLFRRICDRGHTLILTTHTLEQLKICDKLIFMHEGKIVFTGGAEELMTVFDATSLAEVYQKTASHKCTSKNLNISDNTSSGDSDKIPAIMTVKKHSVTSALNQIRLLLFRYFKIITRDKRSIFLLLFQAPLIAFFLGLVFWNQAGFLPLSFYFCITVSVIWIGGINTIREIAREWPMLSREYRAGLSLFSYIIAKVMFTFFLSILQSAFFSIILKLIFVDFKLDVEAFVLLFSGAFSGGILGLTISSCCGNTARATQALPVIFIPQIFFSGILIPFDRMTQVGGLISQLTISRPVYGLFKEAALLHLAIFSLTQWQSLLYLLTGLIIVLSFAVRYRIHKFQDS
jgi:ABC-type multidrug transport system ATPase subunit